VPDRVIGQAALLVPGGRVPVQVRNAAGLFGLQAGAQQVGEQVVVAPPGAHLVQGNHEEPGPFGLLQQRLAARPAGDGITQRAAEPLKHRGLQQERAYLPGLVLEHLLGQEVQDEAVAAGERGREPDGIGLPAQRQGRQLQPGRPALGAGGQGRHRRFRQGRVRDGRRLPQHGRGLVRGEAQVRGAQLGQLPPAPQPGQRQRRVAAAGQHQVQSRRPVLEQEPERGVHGLGVNQVVVVEHQQRLVRVGPGGQLIDQRGHKSLVRRWRGRAQQRPHPFGESRPAPVQCGHTVAPEPRRVVIADVQRQPRHGVRAAPRPVGQQDISLGRRSLGYGRLGCGRLTHR
jgi:hypothetical protein